MVWFQEWVFVNLGIENLNAIKFLAKQKNLNKDIGLAELEVVFQEKRHSK